VSPDAVIVRGRVKHLHDALIHTTVIDEARVLLEKDMKVLVEMKDKQQDGGGSAAVECGITHITYLCDYWTTPALWQSWSDFGRNIARTILKCEIEGVLTTTNHLESFNGLLKRCLKLTQHGGKRHRLDVLVMLFTTKLLPALFEKRAMEAQEYAIWNEQLKGLPGGEALLEAKYTTHAKPVKHNVVAYLEIDAICDQAAKQLLDDSQISTPEMSNDKNGLNFKCYSSLAMSSERDPITYDIFLGFSGTASCTCIDFGSCGGACKHMRAALLKLDIVRTKRSIPIPIIPIPTNEESARALAARVQDVDAVAARLTEANRAALTRVAAGSSIDPVLQAANAVEEILNEVAADEDETGGHQDPCLNPSSPSVDSDDGGEEDASELENNDAVFDFTTLKPRAKFDSRVGIDEQAISRMISEMKVAGPRLGKLAVLLQGASLPAKDLEKAEEIFADIDSLHAQLKRMITTCKGLSENPESPDMNFGTLGAAPQAATPPKPSQRGKKRVFKELEIQEVSPEKATKRKQSFGFH